MKRLTRQKELLGQWLTEPIGTPVEVRRDDGSVLATRTRSEPWIIGGTAVIMVEGIAGGYSLDRVSRLECSPFAMTLGQALRELLEFYDRIQNSDDTGWSADDAKRLAEIRALVAVYFGMNVSKASR